MNAKEMFKKLRYELDEEPRFDSVVSYTKYCYDGCCRINDLIFYKNKVVGIEEEYLTYELLQAINKQIEELGWK